MATEQTVKLDLGTSDVHVTGTPTAAVGYSQNPSADHAKLALGLTPVKQMAEITAKRRKTLPKGKFALPSQRKYPIHDAAHTRNAAARLTQQVKAGKISPGDAQTAKANIRRAAKSFGIHSELSDTVGAGAALKKTVAPRDINPNGQGDPPNGAGGPRDINPNGQGEPPNRVTGGVKVRAQLGVGGSLHVRHMSDAPGKDAMIRQLDDGGSFLLWDYRPLNLGADVDPATAGVKLIGPPAWKDGTPKKLVWVQLAEVGAWKGHPAGPFEMTPATFNEIVANFKRRGLPIPFDHEHASEQDPTSGSIPTTGAPAQGWVHAMDNRGDAGLWGLVEWRDLVRDGIKDGAYAFLSPAIRFGSRDGATGERIGARLTSVAVTNQPFLTHLDGLRAATDRVESQETPMPGIKFEGGAKPILAALSSGPTVMQLVQDGKTIRVEMVDASAASGLSKLAHKPHEYMPQIKAHLGLPPLATAQECADHLDRLRDHAEACGDAEGMHEGIDLSQHTHGLKEMVDAQPGDTWEEVFDAVEALIQAAMEEHLVKEHGAQATDKGTASAAAVTDEQKNEPAATAVAASDSTQTTPPSGGGTKPATATEEIPMTDTNKDITALSDKLAARDTLILAKDAEIKTLSDKVTAKDAEIKTLSDKLKAADTAEETRVLSERHDLYKDKISLGAMTAIYRTDRELFDKEYPYVEPSKRHLMRMHSTGSNAGGTSTGAGGAREPNSDATITDGASTDAAGPSLADAARQLADKTGMSLADAQATVYTAAVRAVDAA